MYIYNKTNKPFSLIFIIKEYNKEGYDKYGFR